MENRIYYVRIRISIFPISIFNFINNNSKVSELLYTLRGLKVGIFHESIATEFTPGTAHNAQTRTNLEKLNSKLVLPEIEPGRALLGNVLYTY